MKKKYLKLITVGLLMLPLVSYSEDSKAENKINTVMYKFFEKIEKKYDSNIVVLEKYIKLKHSLENKFALGKINSKTELLKFTISILDKRIADLQILHNNTSCQVDKQSIKDVLLEVEYQKYGSKENYEIINKMQREQIEQAIKQYKNQTSDNNESEATIKTLTKDEITNIKKDSFIEGNKDAKITLIEYTDPECPFCVRQAKSKVIENLKAKYGEDKVNNILKPFKAVPHENSDAESIAMICVGKVSGVEKYSKYYKSIFENNNGSGDGKGYSLDKLIPLAKEIGVDMKKFQSCYDNKETKSIYEAYTSEGTKLGVQGTPGTIILNNETGKYSLVAGAYPQSEFEKQIDELLK